MSTPDAVASIAALLCAAAFCYLTFDATPCRRPPRHRRSTTEEDHE